MRVAEVPRALDAADRWLHELTGMVPPPVRVPLTSGSFQWRHKEEDVATLLLCKAVRMVSALSAAWELGNKGYTTEAASLLRLVGDFSQEIDFMGEAVIEARMTTAQAEFQKQFFTPLARSLDEYLEREKAYYASRREILAAHERLATKAGVDPQRLKRTASYVNYGLNAYAHGGYETAMELYHGGEGRFDVRGIEEGESRDASLQFIASKATEVLHGLGMVAALFGAQQVGLEVDAFLREADPELYADRMTRKT